MNITHRNRHRSTARGWLDVSSRILVGIAEPKRWAGSRLISWAFERLLAQLIRKSFLFAFGLSSLGLSACGSPSQIPLPDPVALEGMELQVADITDLSGSETFVMAGDVLQIVRDIAPRVEPEENTRFQVRPDGGFFYLDAGNIEAVGRTPEQIAGEISAKLAKIYRYPNVTVNIVSAPGNRVQVGGAVQNPVSIDITAPTSLDQAIVGAGGLLSTADASHVALLRLDKTNRYKAYFTDFGQLLETQAPRRPVMLKRGDIVFVPKSALGNAIEVVDLYMNQLLPFTKSIGLGASYSWTPANNTTTNAVNNSNGN